MPVDLRTRLQRLRPTAHQPPAPAPTTRPFETPSRTAAAPAPAAVAPRRAAAAAPPQDHELPGLPVVTPQGTFQLIESRYTLDFAHGPKRLSDLLGHDMQTAARLARDEALAQAELRSLAFIDTETTGLMGGAGTLVFLVGVGGWDGEAFVLRQYFLRDPADEAAMLSALVADLAPHGGWVTFNGRAFDLPLLEARLTINRQRGALGQRPHLDLLMPARRLYRGRLVSCSLGHIEQHVFRILREDDDVPGWLIPQLYHEYLRSGNPREMRRVIYHNTVDILSMVTLAAHLLEVFAPEGAPRPAAARTPEDLLRLGLWHADNGRATEAEGCLRQALAARGRLRVDDLTLGLKRLALLLKQQARRAEAAALWEQWAAFTLDDPEPFVELAKHYEWHARDLGRAEALRQAEAWTQRALAAVAGWPVGWQRQALTRELERRAERIRHKAGQAAEANRKGRKVREAPQEM